jgi:hypothetical protein
MGGRVSDLAYPKGFLSEEFFLKVWLDHYLSNPYITGVNPQYEV